MKTRTIIFLCSLIALLSAIIVAAVMYLYSGLDVRTSSSAAKPSVEVTADTVKAPKVAKAEPAKSAEPAKAAEPAAKPEAKPEAKPAAKAEPKPEAKPAAKAEPKPEAKPAEPAKVEASGVVKADKKGKNRSWSVTNSDTGKKNTLRQDSEKYLALFDEKGKQKWRVKLGGTIIGDVAEVDIYSNGRIQFLMSDGRMVYLINRMGDAVKGFPIKAPKTMVAGPEKCPVNGKNYWKFTAADGSSSYLTLKDGKWRTNLNQ